MTAIQGKFAAVQVDYQVLRDVADLDLLRAHEANLLFALLEVIRDGTSAFLEVCAVGRLAQMMEIA